MRERKRKSVRMYTYISIYKVHVCLCLKMVLDTTLFNIQQYKVCIKGKVEKSRERSNISPTPWCSSY